MTARPDPWAEALAAQGEIVGLPEPEFEYRFCERKWRFDLAWPKPWIAVEIDGGVWTIGRHQRPDGYQKDLEKLNEAALEHWMVLRVTPQMVESGEALALVERAFRREDAR